MLAGVNTGISRAKGQNYLDRIFQNPVNWAEFELLSQFFSRIFFSCALTVKMKNYFLQDIQIEALLMRACEPIIQTFCHVSTL